MPSIFKWIAVGRRPRYVASIIYAVIILVIFGPVTFHPLSTFIGQPGDSQQFMWYLGWFWHATFNGLNPFIARQVNYPAGINLMQNTSIIAESIFFGPLVYIVNTTFAYNFMIAASVFASAFIGYLFLKEVGARYWLAVFGGVLFELMPYTWAQALGHANLVMTWPIFAVLLMVARLTNGKTKRSSRAGYVLISFFLALEFYTSLEVFTTAVLIGCIASLIYIVLMGREHSWRLIANLKIPFLYSASALLVLIVPGLLIYFLGPYRPSIGATLQPFGVYVNDLISFLLPTPIYALHDNVMTHVSSLYTGNFSEDDGYLGIPVIILVIMSAQALWKSRFHRSILYTLVIVVVLSMGPNLHILGHQTKLLLPWVIIQYIPILRDVLPSRLMLYGDIIVVILIISYFEDLLSRRSQPNFIFPLASIFLIVLFWAPSLPYAYTPVSRTVRTIETGGVLYNKLRGEPTLVFSDNFPSVMQALADGRYAFPVANVYGFQNDSPAMRAYRPIESLPFSSSTEPLIRGMILSTRAHRVLYAATDQQPIPPELYQTLNKICGLPIEPYPNILLWNVPARLSGMWFSGHVWDVAKIAGGGSAWAGSSWGVHTMYQRIVITIISPPSSLSPRGIHFTLHNYLGQRTIYLRPSSTLRLTLNGNADVQFNTTDTFIPYRVIPGSMDTRALSALISVRVLHSAS